MAGARGARCRAQQGAGRGRRRVAGRSCRDARRRDGAGLGHHGRATFTEGTEAFVAAATLGDGTPAVLKLLVPRDGDAAAHETTVLRLADGEGCARLLRDDDERGALLLERLGPSAGGLGLPMAARHEILVADRGAGLAAGAGMRPADRRRQGPPAARYIERPGRSSTGRARARRRACPGLRRAADRRPRRRAGRARARRRPPVERPRGRRRLQARRPRRPAGRGRVRPRRADAGGPARAARRRPARPRPVAGRAAPGSTRRRSGSGASSSGSRPACSARASTCSRSPTRCSPRPTSSPGRRRERCRRLSFAPARSGRKRRTVPVQELRDDLGGQAFHLLGVVEQRVEHHQLGAGVDHLAARRRRRRAAVRSPTPTSGR